LPLLHAAHQLDDLGTGLAVEVGGGFVGEHELRLARQCACDSHPLALTAGQLAGPLARVASQADRV